MAVTVVYEPVKEYTQYIRSPSDEGDFLMHYGVKGMKWRTHKFGKWQNQAVYAVGDQRHSNGEPIYSGLKDKLRSKKGYTPRAGFAELSNEELTNRTNRLRKENDYLEAMQKGNKLDSEFIKATSTTGILDQAASKILGASATAASRVAGFAGYNALVGMLGEDNAKMLWTGKLDGGGGGKKKKDKGNDGGGGGNQNGKKGKDSKPEKVNLKEYEEIKSRENLQKALMGQIDKNTESAAETNAAYLDALNKYFQNRSRGGRTGWAYDRDDGIDETGAFTESGKTKPAKTYTSDKSFVLNTFDKDGNGVISGDEIDDFDAALQALQIPVKNLSTNTGPSAFDRYVDEYDW